MPEQPYIGEIAMVSFDFAPRGWLPCDGRLLQINEFQSLFSLLGSHYGGDGRSTFALPDLRGRFPIGMGAGQNLTPRKLGAREGAESVTLTENQLAAHTHTVGPHTHPMSHTHAAGVHTHTMAHTHDLANHTHYNPHTHDLLAVSASATTNSPISNALAMNTGTGVNIYTPPGNNFSVMGPVIDQNVTSTGAPTTNDTGPTSVPNTGEASGATGPSSATNTAEATGGSGSTGQNLGHDNIPPFQCLNFIIAVEGIYPSRN